MRKSFKLTALGLSLTILLSLGSAAAYAASTASGSTGALAATEYNLEEMLTYALQDEYAARAEYDAIIKAYGEELPFINTLRSEEYHVYYLTQLFKEYGYTLPADKATATVPESLQAAYEIGAKAEENNIAMYEKFLKEELPSDVEAAFEHLVFNSEHHLTAFQNAEEGIFNCQTGHGRGMGLNHGGYGRGGGRGGNGAGMWGCTFN